jgi:hypothetical protein
MDIVTPLVAGFTALTPLAHKVLQQVGQAMSFQDVLQTPPSESLEDGPAAEDGVEVQAELSEWQEEVTRLLLLAGIDVRDPIELRQGRDGGLEVRSAHPQADQIEQLLNSDPQLMQQFRQLVQALADQTANGDPHDVRIALS